MHTPMGLHGNGVHRDLPCVQKFAVAKIPDGNGAAVVFICERRQSQDILFQLIDGFEAIGGRDKGPWQPDLPVSNVLDCLNEMVRKSCELIDNAIGPSQIQITLGSMFDCPAKHRKEGNAHNELGNHKRQSFHRTKMVRSPLGLTPHGCLSTNNRRLTSWESKRMLRTCHP